MNRSFPNPEQQALDPTFQIRKTYPFEDTVPAQTTHIQLADRRVPENTRVIDIQVCFPPGSGLELAVWPFMTSSPDVVWVGFDQRASGPIWLLEDPLHYLTGDGCIFRLPVRIPVPEEMFLGVRAQNHGLIGTHNYSAALTYEEYGYEPA